MGPIALSGLTCYVQALALLDSQQITLGTRGVVYWVVCKSVVVVSHKNGENTDSSLERILSLGGYFSTTALL